MLKLLALLLATTVASCDPPMPLPQIGEAKPGTEGIEPCAEEDSPGPCYWDATARGNGVGRSFTVHLTADGSDCLEYWDGGPSHLPC
jgi:hypothetical protein